MAEAFRPKLLTKLLVLGLRREPLADRAVGTTGLFVSYRDVGARATRAGWARWRRSGGVHGWSLRPWVGGLADVHVVVEGRSFLWGCRILPVLSGAKFRNLHALDLPIQAHQKVLHADALGTVENSWLEVQVLDPESLIPHDLQQIVVTTLNVGCADVQGLPCTIVLQALLLPASLEIHRRGLRNKVDEAKARVALAIDADWQVQEIVST